jgi:hypothetical protein
MRVSNEERTAVADRLSKHYGDGRLDEEEFNERLDRAMKAKTQGDLDGLFADLPDLADAPPAGQPRPVVPHDRRRPFFPRLLFIILAIIIASTVWHAVVHPFFWVGGLFVPWLLIAVVAFCLLRSGAWHRHRR